jgi:hypothetical protein
MLLGDAVAKGGPGSGRRAGPGTLRERPLRTRGGLRAEMFKRKRKSVTLGKNADWSSGQASQSAWSASDRANIKGSAKAHARAAASHRHAAELASKAGNFGTQKLHAAQAKVHDGKAGSE